jgi:hypothetical protein
MLRNMRMVCMTLALTAVTVAISTPCYSQLVRVDIQVHRTGGPTGGTVEIRLASRPMHRSGLCKSGNPGLVKEHCDGDEIEWWVNPGQLNAGERLEITNAPNRAWCFPNIPITITPSSGPVSHASGQAFAACSLDKYGLWWSYAISLYDATGLIATTDPGAIIFP